MVRSMDRSAASIPRGSRLALAIVCAATLMTIVDETVVSVALPTIQRELGFGAGDLSWVVNAYLIAFGSLLLFAGRLGDLVGRRRILLIGVAVFVAASLLCGLAASREWLVLARFVQGVGGALATSVALGMIAARFPDERVRIRAFGIYAAVGASGASIGLFAGGLITDVLDWRAAFFVNVPLGVVALAAGMRTLPIERGVGLDQGADALGAGLVVAGLMAAVAAIVGVERHGVLSTRTLVVGALAAALLTGFVVRQATAERPLLALRVLRSRVVAGTNVSHALMVGAMFGFQFLVALYLQRVQGFGPAEAGLAVLPIALGIGAMSLVGYPRLASRFGSRTLLPAGLLAVALGLALLARAPVDGRYLADVFPSVVLFAIGGGLALPSATTLAMSSATPQDAGMASGLINTSQQVGGALGLAVLATLAAGRTEAAEKAGAATPAALVQGFQLAWSVASGFALAAFAIVLAFVTMRLGLRQTPKPQTCAAR
jgi:EmrB/QacA subfamily drug resistance transporter